jgi:hypothetical protein
MDKLVMERSQGVVDDNKSSRARGVFHIMNTVDISEEVKVLKVITTHLSGVLKNMQSNSDGVKQGLTT